MFDFPIIYFSFSPGKKVLSSDEGDSDSETESLSNDYPKGWGPSRRRKSSPPHHDPEAYHDDMEEEDFMRLQEAAENSVSVLGRWVLL